MSGDVIQDVRLHELWAQNLVGDLDERVLDKVLATARPEKSARFLDVGCGTGRHALMLARRGFRVCALDFTEVVAAARDAARREALEEKVEVRRASILALPFRASSFEHVLCMHVLMHVPALERGLDELARVVKPNGTLTVAENNLASPESRAMLALVRLARRFGLSDSEEHADGLHRWIRHGEGRYLVRTLDVDWFVSACAARSLRLEARFARKFTEHAAAYVPTALGRRVVHEANRLLFRHLDAPRLAFQNVLVFRKEAR